MSDPSSLSEADLDILRSMSGPMTAADVPRLLRPFIYGDPKVGKTDLVARICQELNLSPMWIYSDSGRSTVLKYPDVADRTSFIPFDSFAQIRLLVKAREEGYEPFCNHNAIVLDTVSTQVNNMLRIVVKERPLPKEQPHPSVEGWGHYRMVESARKDTVDVLTRSDMHVFYLAHVRDPNKDDKEKKRFSIRPAGPEATYRVIAQEANLIGWLYKEGKELQRQIQFNQTLQETAGTQIPTIEEKTYKTQDVPGLLAKYVNG